jgi:hypothetical protein
MSNPSGPDFSAYVAATVAASAATASLKDEAVALERDAKKRRTPSRGMPAARSPLPLAELPDDERDPGGEK